MYADSRGAAECYFPSCPGRLLDEMLTAAKKEDAAICGVFDGISIVVEFCFGRFRLFAVTPDHPYGEFLFASGKIIDRANAFGAMLKAKEAVNKLPPVATGENEVQALARMLAGLGVQI